MLKFTEPLDSEVPDEDWRLYAFKDKDKDKHGKIKIKTIKYLDVLHINKKSCYLIGKDERIAQIAVNHSSCSRQHAVIQFRKKNRQIEDGSIHTFIK